MNVVMKLATVLLVAGIFMMPVYADTKVAIASGNWNNGYIWDGGAPSSGDDVYINTGVTVTVTANATVRNVTVGKGGDPYGGNGTLVINAGVVLTVTGDLTLGHDIHNGVVTFQTPCSGELNMTSSSATLSFATPGSCFSGPSAIRRAIAGAGCWAFSSPNTRIVTGAGQGAINVLIKTWPNTSVPVGDPSKAIKRYLSVTPSGSFSGTLRFSYASPGELNGLTESNITAWSYNGSAWVNKGGTDVPSKHYVEVSNISNCGLYLSAADPSTPLPIQVASFSGNVQSLAGANNVALNWMTVSETNNYGFYIQRRGSGETDFTLLQNSFVPGNGTTLVQHSYSYTDENVPAGTYDYRLMQVDMDGLESYTAPIQVIVGKTTDIHEGLVPVVFKLNQNYPNPFNPSTKITFTVAQSRPTTLKVFNLLGEEVATLFDGTAAPGTLYTVSFNASQLGSGVYLYRIQSGSDVSVHKMSLVK